MIILQPTSSSAVAIGSGSRKRKLSDPWSPQPLKRARVAKRARAKSIEDYKTHSDVVDGVSQSALLQAPYWLSSAPYWLTSPHAPMAE